jgi:hypothetical protein
VNTLRRWLAIALVNLALVLVLLALLIVLPPALLDLYKLATARPDARALLPNYKDVAWAPKHFAEFSAMRTNYHDFIGWRRTAFAGETISIDPQGYRRHPQSPEPENAEAWVFGGSTVWGPGVADAMTIPAYVQQFANLPTFNFGESAYTAHQSYNLLIKNYLSGGRPKQVVFYDGANEVVIKCRSELGYFSAAQEVNIRERLQGISHGASLAAEVFAPTLLALRRVTNTNGRSASAGSPEPFDCHTNALKRQRIAAALLLDWRLSRDLVEQHGGRFVAVLQPVSYTGQPYLNHLDSVGKDTLLRQQYDVVYAEIARQLADAKFPYADFTRAFDVNSALYIDFAHVSPPGNQIIGKRIAELLK